ncbi:unnamed protein product, partial [Staurois parvus]
EYSAPSLVSVGGNRIVPHIGVIGVSGGNSAPTLVSVGGIVPHHWCQWGNSAPSLVSVGE